MNNVLQCMNKVLDLTMDSWKDMKYSGAMVEIKLFLPEVNAAVSRHGWTVLHRTIWICEAAFNTIISSKVKWLQWAKAS